MLNDLRCQILNTEISVVTVEDAVAFLAGNDQVKKGQYVCNVSVDDVMYARKDAKYQRLVNQAVLTLPNSRQISSEIRLQGYPRAEKIDVVDLMERVLASSEEKPECRHYFVWYSGYGSPEDGSFMPECLFDKLKVEYPHAVIAGGWEYSEEDHSEEDYSSDDKSVDSKDIISEYIKDSGADIIWVAMPSPMQEEWMAAHRGMFDGIMVGVDYGLNVYCGTRKKPQEERKRGLLYWPRYVVSRCRQLPKGYIGMNLRYIGLTGKKFILRTLSWAPALATMLIIFILSSQNGVASGDTSRELTMGLLHLTAEESPYVAASNQAAIEALDALIRMIAHIGEYAFLSLMIGFAVSVNGFGGKIRMFYMCFLGMIVAVADEFFQIFVPGRYGDLKDVVFDLVGVIAVATLLYIWSRHFEKRKTAHRTEEKIPSVARRKFMNLCLDDITFEEAVCQIGVLACEEGKHYVVTPNVDHVVKIEKDLEFRKIYEEADLILTDGTPLMWIAESLGCPIKEKIPGADMLPKVCEMAAKEGHTMFLFGAAEGVAETARRKLIQKYPGLQIVGAYSPPMGFERDEKEVEKAIRIINQKKPQILVVGLGAPKQEKFIYQYREKIDFHVALPFGAAIDFEAGMVKRAPLWMRRFGLEWLFRFFQEPGRLFRRYFIDDMKIFWLAWKYRYEIIRLWDDSTEKKEGL
ncbi:MAG: VanZ family protein [Lachnospiraceae bacterium]|nr:VanZ family protein [Lachnospiraceae bacterium]